jgi:hypothetical protein
MLIEFERLYYGDNFRKGMSKYKGGKQSSNKLLLQKEKKKKIEPVQACLRQFDKKTEVIFKA